MQDCSYFELLDIKKEKLLSHFYNVLNENNYKIIGVEKDYKFNKITAFKEEDKVDFYVNISSIKKAYLPNNNDALRRQISYLDYEKISKNNKNSLTFLLGILKMFEKYVFIAWDAFGFIYHKKNRSCFVSLKDLSKIKSTHYFKARYGCEFYYVFDTIGFEEFLNAYKNDKVI